MQLTKEQEKRRDELAKSKCSHEAGGEYYKHIAKKDHSFVTRLYSKGFVWGYNACAADMKDPKVLVDALEYANKIIYDEFSTHNEPGVEVLRQWRSKDER